ncbi:MAG: hypothetical protein QMD16_00095 [Desulfitobacteriaceae bacterium]|nr:hypothetical protein [Desulfitobacteriaceae bacterium]
MRSGSKILLGSRFAGYDELSEKEQFMVMQAFFENRLLSLGGYIVGVAPKT